MPRAGGRFERGERIEPLDGALRGESERAARLEHYSQEGTCGS